MLRLLSIIIFSGLLTQPLLIHAIDMGSVQWSQDGSRMLVVLDNELRLLNVSGAEIRRISMDHNHQWIGLSPDGVHVACLTEDRQLWIHNAEAGSSLQIVSNTNPVQAAANLSWSPDGAVLSYSVIEVSIDPATNKQLSSKTSLFTVKADGSSKKLILTIQSQ